MLNGYLANVGSLQRHWLCRIEQCGLLPGLGRSGCPGNGHVGGQNQNFDLAGISPGNGQSPKAADRDKLTGAMPMSQQLRWNSPCNGMARSCPCHTVWLLAGPGIDSCTWHRCTFFMSLADCMSPSGRKAVSLQNTKGSLSTW